METNGGVLNSGDKSSNRGQLVGGEASILRSNLLLDHVGEVILTLTPDGLSWKPPDSSDCVGSTCLRIKFGPTIATELKFSDIYAVELIEAGTRQSLKLLSAGECCLGNAWFDSEMNSFTVHSYQKRSQPCLWTPAVNTFGHKDLQTCQMWVNRINDALNKEVGRPKKLLVFVHPLSGKANGKKTWDTVSPIFSRAKIDTKVTVTQRAGHAFDVMRSATNEELNSYDGAVAVGGDGFFNEILNGFLSSRHKAPLPPAPSDFLDALGNDASSLVHDPNGALSETHYNEESHPLLRCSAYNESGFSCLGTNDASPCIDPESGFSLPNQKFRFGIIPAGSTDAIVMCTTGARDPITSALHIVLGKRVCLDVAQVVRWKTTSTSKVEPCVRYAASFAGYGFYGDVITESEKYRWMGPKRYDYAGTKVFLRHRSYEAEVAYVDVDSGKTNPNPDESGLLSKVWSLNWKKTERIICRANCKVCNKKPDSSNTRSPHGTPYTHPRERQWSRSKGRFLSIGAAIISNRNERAPDGLVADAHLSDGFLHLLLIKDCPHALYLWHLTQLARKGGNPLNFDFVEHYKTPAFTFTSFGNESVWNLDGEPFQAHELSAQVFRGLVSLFATGPEV